MNNLDYVQNEIKQGIQNIQGGISDVRNTTTDVINKTYQWDFGETITLSLLLILVVYVLYLLFRNANERSVTNWLLLIISLALLIQIQQNFNVVKRLK